MHIYLFCKVEVAKSPFANRLTDEAELLLLWLELNNLVMQCFRQVYIDNFNCGLRSNFVPVTNGINLIKVLCKNGFVLCAQ